MELKPKPDTFIINNNNNNLSSSIRYEDEYDVNTDLLQVCSFKPGLRYTDEEIFSVAKILINEKGADPNYKDDDGNSPIKLAIQNRNSNLVKLLLFNGATIPEVPEDFEDVVIPKKIQKIIDDWPTTMGLLATQKLGLDLGNEIDLREYLGGKKRKSNKNKRKSNKNKRKPTKRRK